MKPLEVEIYGRICVVFEETGEEWLDMFLRKSSEASEAGRLGQGATIFRGSGDLVP